MTACSEASERDPNLAIDRDEVKDSIHFYLDGISEEVLPDATLDIIIEKCIAMFEDNQTYTCDVIYCSLLDTLKYLIRKSWVNDGDTSKGVLTKVREKEDTIDIENQYTVVDGQTSENGWEKLYKYFLENPADICECLQPVYDSTFGLISIGGTKQDKYTENRDNPNTRTMYDRGNIRDRFSARRENRIRKAQYKSKFWR